MLATKFGPVPSAHAFLSSVFSAMSVDAERVIEIVCHSLGNNLKKGLGSASAPPGLETHTCKVQIHFVAESNCNFPFRNNELQVFKSLYR